MKKLILSIFLLFPFVSCDKEESAELVDRNYLWCEVVDKDGNDLLDPESGRFKADDIRIYNIVNGKEELLVHGHWDYPYGVIFKPHYNYYPYNQVLLVVGHVTELENNRCTAIIKWDKAQTVVDTMVCEGQMIQNRFVIEAIYMKDQVVWDLSMSLYAYLRLVK